MAMILFGLLLAMLWSAHPSRGGRALRRRLVEAPAAWLNRVGPWRLALVGLCFAAMAASVALLDTEGMLAVSYALGEGVGWVLAFDVATWAEVYAVIWLLGATRMARAAIAQTRRLVAAVLRRIPRAAQRTPRSGRPPRRPPTSAPDDDAAGLGLALAA